VLPWGNWLSYVQILSLSVLFVWAYINHSQISMFGLKYHSQISLQPMVHYKVGQIGDIQVRAPVYAAVAQRICPLISSMSEFGTSRPQYVTRHHWFIHGAYRWAGFGRRLEHGCVIRGGKDTCHRDEMLFWVQVQTHSDSSKTCTFFFFKSLFFFSLQSTAYVLF